MRNYALFKVLLSYYLCRSSYNSMEQSPSCEANSQSASQEINLPLYNPKVHHHAHKGPPLIPILTQMHPVHTFTPYFHHIHSNIVLISTPRSSKWSLTIRSSDINIIYISHISHTCYMPRTSHSP